MAFSIIVDKNTLSNKYKIKFFEYIIVIYLAHESFIIYLSYGF